jgi:hypothetical protein
MYRPMRFRLQLLACHVRMPLPMTPIYAHSLMYMLCFALLLRVHVLIALCVVQEQIEARLEALLRAVLGLPIDESRLETPAANSNMMGTDATTAVAADGTTATPTDGNGSDDTSVFVVPEPPDEAIQQLVEVGFPANRARKALILNRYVQPMVCVCVCVCVCGSIGRDCQ